MIENALIQTLIGKKITAIDIAMIGNNYMEFIEGRTWLSDVGIQFTFDDATFASVFYDENTDRFDIYERSLADHLDEVEHYFIDLSDNEFIQSITDYAISDLKIIESEFAIEDYKGDVLESQILPVEFILEFENGSKIQVATVTVSIDKEEVAIKSMHYNPEGNIWIGFDEIFEIE